MRQAVGGLPHSLLYCYSEINIRRRRIQPHEHLLHLLSIVLHFAMKLLTFRALQL